MSDATKPRTILRTAILSLWGLLTLVLTMTLGIIMYEQYQQGRNPLAFAMPEIQTDTTPITQQPETLATTEVDIFFATPNTVYVRPERRSIELGNSTVRNCRAALALIIEGPLGSQYTPVLSNRTTIRAMYLLENGELVVDFARTLEAGHIKSTSAELLMVRSITRTLFQHQLRGPTDLAVRSIRFLFEGAPYQHTFPAHIDLSEPILNTTLSGGIIEPA